MSHKDKYDQAIRVIAAMLDLSENDARDLADAIQVVAWHGPQTQGKETRPRVVTQTDGG